MSIKQSLYKSINPLTNKLFHTSAMDTPAEIESKLAKAHEYFIKTRRLGQSAMEERFDKLSNVHALLEQRLPEYAELMTLEMGKPLAQAEAEVLKCAGHIEWSIKHSIDLCKDHPLKTRQHKAFIAYDPVGPVLDIVPWNFPFWMPFKSLVPPLILGNPILLKHAPSTPLCA